MLHKRGCCKNGCHSSLHSVNNVSTTPECPQCGTCHCSPPLSVQYTDDTVFKDSQNIYSKWMQLLVCDVAIIYWISSIVVFLGWGMVWGRWRRSTFQSTTMNMWNFSLLSGVQSSHWMEVFILLLFPCIAVYVVRNNMLQSRHVNSQSFNLLLICT